MADHITPENGKKKRGRPRKVVSAEVKTTAAKTTQTKRGRKPKSTSAAKETGWKAVSTRDLAELRKEYLLDDVNRIVRNALTENDITKISKVFEAGNQNPNLFSVEIETMPVTNQMQSGRCWIFSAMNVLREMIAKKYHICSFELSQNYVAFYDKLEKVNWFMNCVLNEKDAKLDERTMQWLLDNGISDGGQWDMAVSLIKKYGICPKTAMKETYTSSHTRAMNGLLNRRLRRFVLDEKQAQGEEEKEALRKECLKECYRLIADCFGMPPEEFSFEYRDEKKKFHASHHITPKQFYKDYLAEDLDQYAVIINAPTKDKPYHAMYSVKYIGNVVSGNEIRYLNLPMKEFKEAVIRQLQAGYPVWFGCDCGKDGDRESGLWDDQAYDYSHTFSMNLDMTKAEMLDARESAMNHAMVLTGVNLVNGKPTRWKIENSWGDKTANKGYYICSDTWFERYVYEASVKKNFLTAKDRKVLKSEVKVLEPWDPFGTLAD